MTAADPLHDLGVRLGPYGGELRVWSEHADALELVIFDDKDPNWITRTVQMERGEGNVWTGRSRSLIRGRRYAVRASGPTSPNNVFNPQTLLLDPYARGLTRVAAEQWRSYVVDDAFDWGEAQKPKTPLDRTVLYEGHVKGLTRLHPGVPEELRGSYAGLAHPAMIEHLHSLGVTSIELLPVHAFVSEQRLIKQGLTNYWGYNTVNFFSPHAAYATRQAQAAGPDAVLREFKGMVKLLHEAGLEVILDVVYNHTAEEGLGGPRMSFRGIDNANYYRQDDTGAYIDVTGCGNTVNFSHDVPQRLVLDSLRYWANEVQADGFRFDLAATLGRDERVEYTRDHPLINAIVTDPQLADVKMIAEPWDVGMGGWQTGNFPDGWHEWNDRYRDRVRNFWLSDIDYARRAEAPIGIGGFATRLAGSSNTFAAERGPLASVNFITAHDGFTLADLVSYDVKHNVGNGESNRDGTDNNRSFNHGAEGPTTDETVLAARRKAMRNLLGTLLLSSGMPMLTAGDEFGRSQQGNNNAYCHDSELTWLDWTFEPWQQDLLQHTTKLLELRRTNPALRPIRFATLGEDTPSASVMDWFDAGGETMSTDDWTSPRNRTLQFFSASTPETEDANRILLIVHGVETSVDVTLPAHDDVDHYVRVWNSANETPDAPEQQFSPGDVLPVAPTSMQLFRAV
ncbi:glycogen debranching protein GlgX [Plantibacter sp. Mn2098]|uniref:glycogen debranching protein GlgX n=1 Tax=Plantibacter sp. Mn2098 TaxID=3395266 RepID=UPI003BE3F5BF